MAFGSPSGGKWFNASAAAEWTTASSRYAKMASKVEDQAGATATHITDRITGGMRSSGHNGLADALDAQERMRDGNAWIGLPNGHAMSQQLSDLEYGDEANPPQPFMRQALVWDNQVHLDHFHNGLAA